MTTHSTNPVSTVNREIEEKRIQEKALEWGFPYVNISTVPINPDVLLLIDKSEMQVGGFIPFYRNQKKLKIAVLDPLSPKTKKSLETLEKKFDLEIFLCSKSSFEKATETLHSEILNKQTIQKRKFFAEEKIKEKQTAAIFEKFRQKIEKLPAEQALNEIQIFSIITKASDIHLQPNESNIFLRFRIDGLLKTICEIDLEVGKSLINRIKYESGMKLNVKKIAQDGHMSFMGNNRKIDVRVSCIPTEFLESIVMRVLDSRKGILSFPDLGFDETMEKKIKKVIHQHNGMILITGPTGSGKTTTLYSMLSDINESEKKIVTLEDPIEYHLDNITQSEVNERTEYNFSNGLKALLRHDPDIILIGEIRDYSVGRLAIEASLTGHLVFSSLHTNSAIGAITRLKNLGIESYNIAASIKAIFAQRLLRKVCQKCQKKTVLNLSKHPRIKKAVQNILSRNSALRAKFQSSLNQSEIEVLGENKSGCEYCTHTGYEGQMAISEVVLFDENLIEKISEGESESEIKKYFETESSFRSLFEDGVKNILLQKTTLEEIRRVIE